MPKLTESIESKQALIYDNFVTAEIRWNKFGKQVIRKGVTVMVITNNTSKETELA